MPKDPADRAADLAVNVLEDKLETIYSEAVRDMQKKLREFTEKYGKKLEEKQQLVEDGELSQADFQRWINQQKAVKKLLDQKIDQMTGAMLNANRMALAAVNDQQFGVFAEGANYQIYHLEKAVGMDLSFTVYDEKAVERLAKNDPELIPRKKAVNGQRDRAWNRGIISNAVTQAIVQGESIPQLARRIARDTASKNGAAMMRYARTAMTNAQNAGRLETLHRAKGMGIGVKKQWLATLDSRTRDSHAEMDGVTVDVDQDFETPLGSKMRYPGDLRGKGGDVWNCRCTVVYVYDGYPEQDAQRRDGESGEVITDMSYRQWKQWKQSRKQDTEESALQKKIKNSSKNKTASESIRDSIAEAYDYHIQKHGIRKISAEDAMKNAEKGFGNGFQPDISKLDEQGQKNAARAIQALCREYDTPLDSIRTMTAQEAMGNTAFAYVRHNYETDSCEMVINPIKCKDTEKLTARLQQLRDKGYLPNGIKDEQLPEYVITHEFGHTLLNMQEKLTKSRNLVGADYNIFRSARKEIETIYSEYTAEVGRIDKALKSSEMDFIMNPTEDAQKKTKDLIREMNNNRISLYSLTNIDEFVAESFSGSWFGATSSPYAKRCMEVLDKYFKR